MKVITLKKLTLKHFMGIKDLTIDFKSPVTTIRGKNRAGKSTVQNSFLWLLFGKNSEEKADFDIKTYDEKGVVIPKVDHTVIGELEIDGTDKVLTRNYKENWGSVRGEEEVRLKSHSTEYSVDELTGLKEKEYKEEINNIIPEEIFKLITNPYYFNSDKFGWLKRRELIFEMVSIKSDTEILNEIATLKNKDEISYLTNILNSNGDLNAHKTGLVGQKSKLKQKLEVEIPAQIKEAKLKKPENIDFEEISRQINEKQVELRDIDQKIIDANKANEEANKLFQNKQNDFFTAKRELSAIEESLKTKYDSFGKEEKRQADTLNFEIEELSSSIQLRERSIESLHTEITTQENIKQALLKDWHAENEKTMTFDESKFSCPTCLRPFEPTDVESKKNDLTVSFNNEKVKNLARITEKGKEAAAIIKESQEKITKLKDEIKGFQKTISEKEIELGKLDKIIQAPARESFESVLNNNKEYQDKKKAVEILEASLKQRPSLPSNDDLLEQKDSMTNSLDLLKKEYDKKDRVGEVEERVKELEQEGRQVAQQISDLERKKDAIQEFTRYKVNLLEEEVNKKFKFTKFRMFEQNITNDDITDTCVAIYNGTPYPAQNSEAKLNIGIDCINAISDHFQVRAPIFIDSRESVTEIIPTESQVINLIVDPKCETLTVE